MVKIVPQADAKSASMGWFFDPGFIQKVQRIAADVENPSMESIDSVLFALREMGYIRVGNLGAQIEREREKLKTKIERILCSLFDEHGLVCQSIDIKPTIIGGNTGRSSILYYAKITFKN